VAGEDPMKPSILVLDGRIVQLLDPWPNEWPKRQAWSLNQEIKSALKKLVGIVTESRVRSCAGTRFPPDSLEKKLKRSSNQGGDKKEQIALAKLLRHKKYKVWNCSGQAQEIQSLL